METAVEPIKKRPPVDHGDYARAKVDVGKAFELRMKGMQLPDIAKLMGVTKQAVHARLKQFSHVLNNPEIIKVYDENVDKILSAAQVELVSAALDPAKLKKSQTYPLVASYGILFDKQRLVRGLSTSNVMYADMDAQEKKIEDEMTRLTRALGVPQDVVIDAPPDSIMSNVSGNSE